MTRIAFVGAGSVEFTRDLLGDILSFPELADATIALHDIDPERLATGEAMARWTNRRSAPARRSRPTSTAAQRSRAATT
jgi:Alpha-galactosidases/6-phospho-beta-glucosidases, family 4 of glycosyl hydrolases